jgi:hypothetical protein
MLYRDDVGHVMPITRQNAPILFWFQIVTFFALGLYIMRLGVRTLNRDDGDEE